MDIRDDRIMRFFDGKKRDGRYTFDVLINAVTAGEFELPPTLVEAMYDDTYKAIHPGYRVIITP